MKKMIKITSDCDPSLVSPDVKCVQLIVKSVFEDKEIKEVIAINYHKVLAYKDEYEVARLHLGTRQKVAEKFENVKKIKFHLV